MNVLKGFTTKQFMYGRLLKSVYMCQTKSKRIRCKGLWYMLSYICVLRSEIYRTLLMIFIFYLLSLQIYIVSAFLFLSLIINGENSLQMQAPADERNYYRPGGLQLWRVPHQCSGKPYLTTCQVLVR